MTDLTLLGAAISDAYHTYLADPAALPEFLAASSAYHEALRERHGEFWQRLESGAFVAPVAGGKK